MTQVVLELEAGRAKGTKHTAKCARALGQDAMWIEIDEGRMREPGKAARAARKAADAPRVPIAPDDYERIPIFDIHAAEINMRREGIYVMRIDDTLMVKRVTMHPKSKRVTLRSDNPRYETYPDLDPDRLGVAGGVIGRGRSLG